MIVDKNILIVKNLKKSYGTVKAVRGVSFSVKEKEVFGILGPNGAGKTTTLEMIESMRSIGGGQVNVNGLNVKTDPFKVKEIIGVQLQSTSFFDFLTLSELLVLFANLYGQQDNPKQLLKEVGLENKANTYVKNLSGGQKQRFSIAAALVNQPVALFLDEPTTGLDPQARRNLWQLIRQIRDKGVTIILTTHYMEEAEVLCDRVAIMDNGRIIALDSPENLIKALLKRGFKRKTIRVEATLEDVFIDLTGHELRE